MSETLGAGVSAVDVRRAAFPLGWRKFPQVLEEKLLYHDCEKPEVLIEL